jgi:phage-related protein
MEIDDSDADAAKSFVANHTPRSARLGFISDALMKLVVELDKATRAIKEATEESKTGSAQIRENLASAGNAFQNNLAKLGESINSATELEKESSKKLAKSVNTLTLCLVLIGFLQVVLQVVVPFLRHSGWPI